jgi:hypothetical protein
MRSLAGTLPLRELQTGGYGKVITHVVIGLKTVKGTKQLKLDPTIYDTLQKEKARPRRCAARARWGGARTPQTAPPWVHVGASRRRHLHRGKQRVRQARRQI